MDGTRREDASAAAAGVRGEKTRGAGRRSVVAGVAIAVVLGALGALRPAGGADESAPPRLPRQVLGGLVATLAVAGLALTIPRSRHRGAPGAGSGGEGS